jgi:hypothetical protein
MRLRPLTGEFLLSEADLEAMGMPEDTRRLWPLSEASGLVDAIAAARQQLAVVSPDQYPDGVERMYVALEQDRHGRILTAAEGVLAQSIEMPAAPTRVVMLAGSEA